MDGWNAARLARAEADLADAKANGDEVWIEAAEKELAAMRTIVAMDALPPVTKFAVGDRCFSHYTMKWGTIEAVEKTERGRVHGVTGNPMPDTTWYRVRADDGSFDSLDDADGDWNMARVVWPSVATRFGYGVDPRPHDSPLTWEDWTPGIE